MNPPTASPPPRTAASKRRSFPLQRSVILAALLALGAVGVWLWKGGLAQAETPPPDREQEIAKCVADLTSRSWLPAEAQAYCATGVEFLLAPSAPK